MTAAKTNKKTSFWRSDAFIGAAALCLVLVAHQATDFFGTLERRFYDYGSTHTQRTPSDRIAVIAIDDASVSRIGRWPWSRDVHAQLIEKLSTAKPKSIAYTAFFFEPQTDRGLVYIKKLRELFPPPADAGAAGDDSAGKLQAVLAEAEAALDTDGKLAKAMTQAGNVLLPSVYKLGEPKGRPDEPMAAFANRFTLNDAPGFSLPSESAQQPLPVLGAAASGIGHLNQTPDADGTVRREPLLVNYFGRAVPSMALSIAAHSLNLTMADIRLDPANEVVQLGRLRIKTDAQAAMLPQFYSEHGGRPAFTVDSFHDVLTGKIPVEKYTGKIVLIGGTAAGLGATFATPANPTVPPVEYVAHTTSSLLGEHFLSQPAWGLYVQLGALLIVAAYITAVLPRLSAGIGAIGSAALLVLLLGFEFAMLSRAFLWIELVLPAAMLVIGHVALTTKRFLVTEASKLKTDEESAETNRMMGLALQGKGDLDMAFDRFRRVPVSEALMDNLGHLALDFERKRQFNKAQAVYEHMFKLDPNSPGLAAKLNRAKNLSETVILGGGGGHPGGTLVLGDGSVEKPMLGRYQVEKELGKGAMGVVYLGKDPKIGRVVAIKTMALSQEFEGSDLDDARERFFREAETAGRLQHQNIVTIFDAGEEHDLAYIAMEFLKGKDLADFCRDGHLLPPALVISICARVAEALAYAHAQNVVHRDIKPANIMYDSATDTVKVTDFGIARITDSSKTKTGLVLGTPSFMSPEQIAGQKVDGQSDQYSLGVMLFQLLTGVLPFRGDSMAELMYKIANEPAPDIRKIKPELSARLSVILQKVLQKNPKDRFPGGKEFAAELRAVGSEITGTEVVPEPAGSSSVYDRTTQLPAADDPSMLPTQALHRPPQ